MSSRSASCSPCLCPLFPAILDVENNIQHDIRSMLHANPASTSQAPSVPPCVSSSSCPASLASPACFACSASSASAPSSSRVTSQSPRRLGSNTGRCARSAARWTSLAPARAGRSDTAGRDWKGSGPCRLLQGRALRSRVQARRPQPPRRSGSGPALEISRQASLSSDSWRRTWQRTGCQFKRQ